MEKILKTSWTGRNANSVAKLLELAEAMEERKRKTERAPERCET
jgi:hypothetical protein